jgi:RNA polymerase sigma-70 factor, ECF subfamily
MSELELIARAKTGDQKAFGVLMDEYLPRVYALSLRVTANSSDAEDVAQETFIKAYQALPKFRQEASFGTWIYRIAWNTAMGLKKKHTGRLTGLDAGDVERIEDTSPSVLDSICDEDQKKVLQNLILQLPPKQRCILSMRVYENLPFQQIAKIVQRTVGSVKANYFHAVKSLQAAFSKEVSR